MGKFSYTIKSRPTYFEGRRYNSGLEASWAAFFRNKGIVFEYEPDLGLKTWYPDFIINLNSGNMLAEVKPFSSISQWRAEPELLKKISASLDKDGFEVALLGISPTISSSFYYRVFPPDPELEPDGTEPTEDFEDIDFGDPKDVLTKWNLARNEVGWKWGE